MSDNLPDDPETLKAMLPAALHESERLRQIIKELQRHRFARKAESLPEEQMLLGLEDVQQVAANTEASQDETARNASPDPTVVPSTGLSSPPWWRLASSTTSIRSPISPTY